tara:strand:+ start:372 stop:659 length:288 start_codon:yes stop_codon:yes gene_type:complete
MGLIYFILSTYGISGLISILNFRYIKKDWKILNCPYCLGFWVGLILFMSNSYTDLFNFNITILNALLISCIGGASTYILGVTIDDDGIKINKTKK